jgi:twinkle protein
MDEALEKLYKSNNEAEIEPNDYLVKLSDVSDEIDLLRKNGFRKGYDLGFNCLQGFYSIVPGAMTFITGSPDHGKTYFWFECLINLSMFSKLKHIIFTPEMGDPHEIYADLCGMVVGKKFGTLTPKEMDIGKEFIEDHISLIEPQDNNFTIDDWFYHAEKYKPDTLTGDPFNEFTHDFKDDYNRQDLYIERQLGKVRRKTKSLKLHTCIITHPRDQHLIEKDGFRYYPPPTPRDYAGGQAWYRKGLGMICIWRAPEGVKDISGIPYEKNETHVIIQKAKPRGVGKKGTIKLFFDLEKLRYYEKDQFAGNKYGHEIHKEVAPF